MTLSTPVKIVALAGLALVLAMGGLLMLTKKHGAPSATPVVAPQQPIVHHDASAAVKHHAPKPHVVLTPGMPVVLATTLLRHPVAVVAVYSSRVPADRPMLTEARAGAHVAHAGFVAADVAHNKVAVAIARWSNSVGDPAVIVVRRPGKIVFTVSGTTDRHTVAQAALTSK